MQKVEGNDSHVDSENNSHILNFNPNTPSHKTRVKKESTAHTPKLVKNISEIKLKKVEALTPKSSFTSINNKLKQVWALNPPGLNKSPQVRREQTAKMEQHTRKKRNLTAVGDSR